MKCGICGKEMIKLADGVNYGCDYCNIQTLLYKPNTGEPTDRKQKYIDMLHKESSELLVNSLAEKDKQIVELQEKVKKLEYDNGELASLIDTMRYKDPKINELQKQLEEKEKGTKYWHNLYQERDKQFQSVRQRYYLLNRLQSNYDKKDKLHLVEMQCLELVEENKQLKQQLKSQPAEIVEKIKAYYEAPIYNKPEAHTKVSFLFSRLDIILKEYQK